jgi:hypothetical protein
MDAETKTCPVCGDHVPHSRGNRPRIYCSVKCRSRQKERAKRKTHPEKDNARRIAWRKANPEKARKQLRLWRDANPEKIENTRVRKVEKLSDSYIRYLITQRTPIKEVPQPLIDLKREQVATLREVKRLIAALKEKQND